MKILWIESLQHYGAQRAAAVAPALGIGLTCMGMSELRFTPEGIFASDGADVVAAHDAVIIRSFAPYVSEVLTIARLFHMVGKPALDRNLVSEGYAMSKMHDYLMLAKAGLPVPRTEQCFTVDRALEVAESLGWPVVLKGVHGARGKYVFLARDEAQLRAIWPQHEAGWLMVQEYLEAESDYRVLVIGGKALPQLVERFPLEGDFRTNSEVNEKALAHEAAAFPQMVAVAEKAAETLGRCFSGVDIRVCRGIPYILEANRRPGFKAFEEATGYDVATHFLGTIKKLLGTDIGLSVTSVTSSIKV